MKYELLIKEGAQADITEGFQQYSKISPWGQKSQPTLLPRKRRFSARKGDRHFS